MISPRTRLLLLTLLACLVLAAGCGSLSPLGTARTLSPGKIVWSSGVNFVGTPTGREDAPGSGSQMEVGFSAGLSSRLELGIRAFGVPATREWMWGLDTQLKVQLVRSKNRNRGVNLALAPRASFQQLGTAGATWEAATTHLAVMVGINLPGGNEVVISPQIGGLFLMDRETEAVEALVGGGSIGFAWKVAHCVTLMPNLTILYSTLRMDDHRNVWFYRVSLLFMLGERD